MHRKAIVLESYPQLSCEIFSGAVVELRRDAILSSTSILAVVKSKLFVTKKRQVLELSPSGELPRRLYPRRQDPVRKRGCTLRF